MKKQDFCSTYRLEYQLLCFEVSGFKNSVQDWVILSWRVFPSIPFLKFIYVIKSTLVSVLLIGLHQSIILLQISLVPPQKLESVHSVLKVHLGLLAYMAHQDMAAALKDLITFLDVSW